MLAVDVTLMVGTHFIFHNSIQRTKTAFTEKKFKYEKFKSQIKV